MKTLLVLLLLSLYFSITAIIELHVAGATVMIDDFGTVEGLNSFKVHCDEKEQLNRIDYSDQPSGVACPKCGKELRVSISGLCLASIPLKEDAWCNACGWKGYL